MFAQSYSVGEKRIDAVTLARRAVAVAEDRQASEIMLLDVRGATIIADYFVICTAGTERQIRAVLKALDEELVEAGAPNPRIEGSPETGWILLDFNDVIIHIFSPEQREYYRLERLWRQAQPIVVVQ
jgi:ribosome-associated protein